MAAAVVATVERQAFGGGLGDERATFVWRGGEGLFDDEGEAFIEGLRGGGVMGGSGGGDNSGDWERGEVIQRSDSGKALRDQSLTLGFTGFDDTDQIEMRGSQSDFDMAKADLASAYDGERDHITAPTCHGTNS